MKETELFKQVADRQMPDLEKIRENILNSEAPKKETKIFHLKPSRFIAVAVVSALALAGTIAAVASGGVFNLFNPKPAVTATADEAAPVKKTPDKPKKANKKDIKKSKTQNEEKLVKKLNEKGLELSWCESLGTTEGYEIVYGGGDNTEDCKCKYIIDNYTFTSSTQYSPYGLGLYIITDNGESYTLTEARDKNVIPDITPVINAIDENQGRVDFDFTYRLSEGIESWFLTRFNSNVATVAKLGKVDGFTIYYNLRGTKGGTAPAETLGDYSISTTRVKRDYSLGLYVSDGSRFGDLTEAYNNGWITDITALEEELDSNPKTRNVFTIQKTAETATEADVEEETQAEDETEPETEAPTEVVTEQETEAESE